MEIGRDREEDPAEIEAYWTPERMAGARPRGRVKTAEGHGKAHPPRDDPRTRPGFDPGAVGGVAPSVAAPVRVADPASYPYRTIGKLFFRLDDEDWVGSASVIGTRLLLTVAHNLYEVKTGSWSRDIRFVPAYTDGAEPYGRWSWNKAWIWDKYYKEDLDAYDFGLIRMDPGGPGGDKEIGKTVGYLGVTVDRPPPGSWDDIGYPGPILNGKFMIEAQGKYTRSSDAGLVVGKEGAMGKGASGGPWLIAGESVLVNGVHSMGSAATDESFSPFFRTWMLEFIDRHQD